MLIKSPGGSNFPYFYKGGEIHCLKYGSFHDDSQRLIALMKEEEKFVVGVNRQLRIWVDLYETNLTDEVISELLDSLKRLEHRIVKLALVGCGFTKKLTIQKRIRTYPDNITIPIQYFKDPEVAKTWLVSE